MIDVVLFGVFSLFLLYVLYVMVMRWKRVRDERGELTTRQKVMAFPLVVAGYVVDVFVNVFVATALFFDLPQEATLTERLQRYIDRPHSSGWRVKVARWLKPILNKHDKNHLR